MTQEAINESLYRPILNGSEFNSLIASSNGKVVKLATGNTKVAINEMAKWAKKYAYQTQDLAPQLSGINLQETLNIIQWFLYNHINYNIDGKNQNLKSPSNAWATRQEGTDCKSYSIFASTILLNLGINHFLRRIKQENQSDAFTHVYVVIPKNQSIKKLPNNAQFNIDYFIIDGTIEHNIEIPFLEKDDIYMESTLPIYGLSAPSFNALACGIDPSCGCSTPTVAMPLAMAGYQGQDQKAIDDAMHRFLDFTDDLENQGIPRYITDRAIMRLNTFIEKGIEPTVSQLFESTNSKEYAGGLGLDPATIAALLSALSEGGSEGETITDETTGDVIVPQTEESALKKIVDIIPLDIYTNTFGAVFANGFNLSCWNSTFTPAEVTEEVARIHVPFFTNAVKLASTAKTTKLLEYHLNFLLKAVDVSYTMYAEYLVNGANWRDCSKEAIDIYVNIVTGAKTQTDIMLTNLQSKYDITVTTQTIPAEYTYPSEYTGAPDHRWSESQHGDATYRIVKFNERIEDDPENFTTPEEVIGSVYSFVDEEGYTNYVDANGEVIKKVKLSPQQAGMSGLSMLLLAGVVIGGVVAATKKKKAISK